MGPLPPRRGSGRREGKGRSDARTWTPRRPATPGGSTDVKHDDAELEQMRAGVSCAVLLERAGYELDKAESTRKCLKYRRGAGEVVIVNHAGRGWWDPMRPGTDRRGRGDVFTLAQHLDSGLNFGQVRKLLIFAET